MTSDTQTGCLTVIGLASALGFTTGAQAQFACPGTVEPYEGQSACVVAMNHYAPSCSAGGTVCLSSLLAATNDARSYFKSTNGTTQLGTTYVLQIPSGNYDLSGQTPSGGGTFGALQVGNINPTGSGCLLEAGYPSTVALSGSGCFIVTGNTSATTTLTIANNFNEIYGETLSHVMFQNMTFAKHNLSGTSSPQTEGSSTYGTVVSTGSVTLSGKVYPTLTVDVPSGLPTPYDLYNVLCNANLPGGNGCNASPPYEPEVLLLRAYTSSTGTFQPVQSTTNEVNSQQAWALPTTANGQLPPVPPVKSRTHPTQWTLTMSYTSALPTEDTTAGATVCMKVDSSQTFFIVGGSGSSDVIFNNITWLSGTRGTIRGVSSAGTMGSPSTWWPLGAQFLNDTIVAGPIDGHSQCVAQAGGLQFGQPTDQAIHGSVVYNLHASDTGDDTIAIFNDDGDGSNWPTSTISSSTIAGSFVRSIGLFEAKAIVDHSSDVSVDTFTQTHVTGCDPLVIIDGCPVLRPAPQ